MSEFSMVYNLFGCMHACILHVLSVGLTKVCSTRENKTVGNFTCVTNYKLVSLIT